MLNVKKCGRDRLAGHVVLWEAIVHKMWEAIIHKIFNMRGFPQGHLKVFGYKSDCSCCTAEKDGTENTAGKGLTAGEAATALISA